MNANTTNLEHLLSYLDPNMSRDEWLRVAMALKRDDEGNFGLFDAWSSGGETYHPQDCEDVWRQQPKDGGATVGTLIYWAKQNGFGTGVNYKPIKPKPRKTPEDKPKRDTTAKDLREWHSLASSGSSTYLDRKDVADVSCEAVRFADGYISALIQAFGDEGKLVPRGVQKIFDRPLASGTNKLFSSGLAKKGAFIVLGNIDDIHGGAIICEGLSTGLTIKKAGARLVLCALDAGNIAPVVESIRTLYPDTPLTIASDNDQKTKGNPGYTKALDAAYTFGCALSVADFTGVSASGTDFNDLAAVGDLDLVRFQLRDARQPESQKYLPPLRFGTGTHVLKAAHGQGKTTQIKANVTRWISEGLRVLYITHSAALAKDAGAKLDLDCYEDTPGDLIKATSRLSICVNSLYRLQDDKGNVTPFDVVIIDESEQFVEALGGSHIGSKSKVLKALRQLTTKASTVICADADAGVLTDAMLDRWRPQDDVKRLEHAYPVGEDRTVNLQPSQGDLYKAILDSDVPTFTVTNVKAQANIITALLEHNGKTVKTITGDTSGNEQDFLRDIEKNAQRDGIQHVVCSPSVKTGNDLSGGYFKRVCGVFSSRIGKPESALQALWRVRTEVDYHLFVDPTKRHEFVNINAKYSSTQAYEDHLTGNKLATLARFDDYTALRKLSERLTQTAQRDYKGNLLVLMTKQGFTFTTGEHDPSTKALVKLGRELAQKARFDAIEFDDSFETIRDNLRGFYRLSESDPIRPWIEQDNDGRYRKQIERLEQATGNALDSFIDEVLERVDVRDDMPNIASWREFNQRVLEAVGFRTVVRLWQKGVLEQLELPRYSKNTLEPLRQWIESNRVRLSGLLPLPSPEQLQGRLVFYVGRWLKRLGLKHRAVGKNAKGMYSLECEALSLACEVLKRRGREFVEIDILENSLPTLTHVTTSPPFDPLPVFRRALEQGLLDAKASSLAKIRQWLATGNRVMLQKAYEAMPKDMKAVMT